MRWIKRALARALVRTTTAAEAYPGAPWSTVLEPEAAPPRNSVAPPFAADASHLEPARYETPRAITAPLAGVLYYSYLNVLLTRGRAVLRDTNNTPMQRASDTFYWRDIYFADIEDTPGASFVFRSPANNFYHTIGDNLPRLYALHEPRYADLEIALLIPGRRLQPFEEYFLRRLLPPNVRIQHVKRGRLYRLQTGIFSSYLSRDLAGYLPRKYLDFFLERTLPTRPRQKHARIYVIRRGSGVVRRILNEDEVQRAVERFGFQPYALEMLPISQQIELFYDAAAVIAPHGAGLVNLLFADHVPVIELHPTPAAVPTYYFLCWAMGHPYHFVCSTAPMHHSDFTVDIDALTRVLERLPD